MASEWIIRDCTRYKVCPSGRGADAADTYEGAENVVYQVAWTCREQVDIDGAMYVAKRLDDTVIEPFVGGGSLVPFAEVTEAQIIEWLHAALERGEGQSAEQIEADVEAELATRQPSNKSPGVPWK